MVEWMRSQNLELSTNTKIIIPPHELDVVIPEHSLAIEYCGLYWHSEQMNRGKEYHRNKYEKCKHAGIRLITLYEDEWTTKQELIKTKLSHIMGISKQHKVYARTTTIIEVDIDTRRHFFNTNHIQGDGTGSLCYGLLHHGELIACMAFKRRSDKIYELTRYATSCIVAGGFSKLLKHFTKVNKWDQIISFADLRWSDGTMYQANGWILDSVLPPDYYYSPDGNVRVHKFNYRRKYLPKMLKEFDPNKSEWENCKANRVYRIWDCGKQRWIMNNPLV